jgi:hypothetical protein
MFNASLLQEEGLSSIWRLASSLHRNFPDSQMAVSNVENPWNTWYKYLRVCLAVMLYMYGSDQSKQWRCPTLVISNRMYIQVSGLNKHLCRYLYRKASECKGYVQYLINGLSCVQPCYRHILRYTCITDCTKYKTERRGWVKNAATEL